MRRAVDVLRSSPPDPLGSGSLSDKRWEFEVDGSVARQLVGVQSIEDHIQWQYSVAAPGTTTDSRTSEQSTRGLSRLRSWWGRLGDVHKAGIYVLVTALISGYFVIRAAHDSGTKPPAGNPRHLPRLLRNL